MLRLIDADSKYLEGYKEAYLLEKDLIEKGITKKHDRFFLNPDEEDVIQRFKDNRDSSKLPSNYVPSYDYFAVDDDKFIGVIHIRIRLTEDLLKFGGHIGYGVNPKYRKMGYGTEMLRLAINEYKDLIEEDRLLMTCDDDNIGSYKIIEANGGILEDKVENIEGGEKFISRRYWIDLNKKRK